MELSDEDKRLIGPGQWVEKPKKRKPKKRSSFFRKPSNADLPTFAETCDRAFKSIERMLRNDAAASKLAEIVKAGPEEISADDLESIRRLRLALQALSDRCQEWLRRIEEGERTIIDV